MIHIGVKQFEPIFIEHEGLIGIVYARRKPRSSSELIISFHAGKEMRVYRTGAKCDWPKGEDTILNTPINKDVTNDEQ